MARPELPDDDDAVPVLKHWGEPTATAAVIVGTAPVRHIHKWGPFDFLNDERTCACGMKKSEFDLAKHAGKNEAKK